MKDRIQLIWRRFRQLPTRWRAAVGVTLLLAISVVTLAYQDFDLWLLAPAPAEANGAYFFQEAPPLASGTGVFDAFLRVSGNVSVVQGYNTDYRPLQFNEDSSWTKAIKLSTVTVINYEGLMYREFVLDVNQISNDPNQYISLNELQLFEGTTNTVTGYTAGSPPTLTGTTLIYDMNPGAEDTTNDVSINIDSTQSAGSGKRDVTVLVPDSLFDQNPNCAYGASGCGVYVYLYSKFGMRYPNNDGFEEWGTLVRPYLEVTKTTDETFTRTYDWEIDKSVTPASWDLFNGESGTSRYTVSLTRTGFTNSDFGVSGTITIEYPTERPDGRKLSQAGDAIIVSVEDIIDGVGPVTVDCGVEISEGNPYTLSVGDSLVCTYSSDLPDSSTRTNTATVTLEDSTSFSGEADIDFTGATPTSEVNGTVNVTDTNVPGSWQFNNTGSQTYDITFDCDDQGENPNTATITETGQSADATVTVACYDLAIEKDADTAHSLTYNWTITKEVTPDEWNLFVNESATSKYTVTVSKDEGTADDFSASGLITVTNSTPIDAMLSGIEDVAGGSVASVDCCVEFPYTLPAGNVLTCSYDVSLPSGDNTTNVVTATQTLKDYDYDLTMTIAGNSEHVATAAVIFGDATTVNNDSVTVIDSVEGNLGTFSDDGNAMYTQTFECGDSAVYPNTADMFGDDDVLLGSDSASVTVNCYELDVEKDAAAEYTRTFDWTIDKEVMPDEWNLFVGESATSWYTVTVTKDDGTDSDFKASGLITLTNPAPVDATITDVADVVDGTFAASVDCGVAFPYTLPADSTLTCTYMVELPDSVDRTNVATATQEVYTYDYDLTKTADGSTDYSGSALVDFGDPTTLVHDSVSVNDSVEGNLGPFNDDGTATYTATFECGESAVYLNTASMFGDDDVLLGSDSASVSVNCYELTIDKDASTVYTRTFGWEIDKEVSPDSWELFVGESATSWYTVTVTKDDGTDSSFKASGLITLTNPAPVDATINDVTDLVDGTYAASVDCGVAFPYTLGANSTLTCSYMVELPDSADRTNTATATQQLHDFDYDLTMTPAGTTDHDGSAPVDFGDPTTLVDDSVTVTDSNGDVWIFGDDGVETYTETFECGESATYDNDVDMVGDDTGNLLGTDSASVTVNCYELEVSKDANTSWNRYWDWQIDKSADLNTVVTLLPGEVYTVGYTVTLTAAYTNTDFVVDGTITITNPAPMPAQINALADTLAGVPVTLDCVITEVPAASTVTCNYSIDVEDETTRTNTVTVTQQLYDYDWDGTTTDAGESDHVATADAVFADDPTEQFDECIDVYDTHAISDANPDGYIGTVCGNPDDLTPVELIYDIVFGPFLPEECGFTYEFPNTARYASQEDEPETGSDDYSVFFFVECVGCTYTQGYWKTHSEYGPAGPPDPTWLELGDGPDTVFYLSGQSYLDVMWTPPKRGNAYYILAHQFIAAYLNTINVDPDKTADAPPSVQAALDDAVALFATYKPDDIVALSGGDPLRAEFIMLAGILGDFNEGLIGPGHCD